jgi:hypothetical protein
VEKQKPGNPLEIFIPHCWIVGRAVDTPSRRHLLKKLIFVDPLGQSRITDRFEMPIPLNNV